MGKLYGKPVTPRYLKSSMALTEVVAKWKSGGSLPTTEVIRRSWLAIFICSQLYWKKKKMYPTRLTHFLKKTNNKNNPSSFMKRRSLSCHFAMTFASNFLQETSVLTLRTRNHDWQWDAQMNVIWQRCKIFKSKLLPPFWQQQPSHRLNVKSRSKLLFIVTCQSQVTSSSKIPTCVHLSILLILMKTISAFNHLQHAAEQKLKFL